MILTQVQIKYPFIGTDIGMGASLVNIYEKKDAGGRAERRSIDVKGNMKSVGVREEDAVESVGRRLLIGCGQPLKDTA